MDQVKVICFYTLNTPYEQEATHLKSSCEKWGVPLILEGIPSQGSWEKNVAMKPQFILDQFEKTSVPILWVDADAAFLQKPNFSLFSSFDVSVRFMEIFAENPNFAVAAGTIFINQTKEGHQFLKEWVAKSSSFTGPYVDQRGLYETIQENKSAKILPMPISYCKIFDLDQFFINDEDVVIEHRQASRTLKT